jgi:hypothetical protein
MTLDHTKATATITLDGLGICCFNNRTHQWQVAFLRQPEHDLRLSVFKGLNSILPEQIVSAGSRVNIYTQKGVCPDYEKTFKEGFFDNGPVNRKAGPANDAERENFRWVVDLADSRELPQGNVKLKKSELGGVLTTISDAVFYTKDLSASTPNDLFLLPEGVDPNQLAQAELAQHEFGRINDVIAADIVCEPGGSVVVEVDGRIVSMLEAQPGGSYTIALDNARMEHDHGHPAPGIQKGDFSLYYDAVDVTKKLALWGLPSHEHSGRVSCDAIRMSGVTDLSLIVS